MTKDRDDRQGQRRRGGLRPLAATLPKVTRKALGRRGLAEGSLIAEWPEIVGETLAARCLPLKLSFADPKRRAEGTLTLQVESAWTLELQHLAPQLIERINQTLGYAAVSRLAFRQGPLPQRRTSERPPQALPQDPPVQAGEGPEAAELSAAIDDEGLRGALEGLGRALRKRKQT
ncbi:MAG: DUF721 domain-containing protein [Kiloniellales bacterium]|nr:DUF721 domain-containing protein [Kiloniellales bacterium]